MKFFSKERIWLFNLESRKQYCTLKLYLSAQRMWQIKQNRMSFNCFVCWEISENVPTCWRRRVGGYRIRLKTIDQAQMNNYLMKKLKWHVAKNLFTVTDKTYVFCRRRCCSHYAKIVVFRFARTKDTKEKSNSPKYAKCHVTIVTFIINLFYHTNTHTHSENVEFVTHCVSFNASQKCPIA